MTAMTTRIEYETTVDDHIAKLDRFVGKSPVGSNFSCFAYFAIVALAWTSAVLFYLKQGHRNDGYILSGLFALALTIFLRPLYRWYQTAFWASVFSQSAVRGLVGSKVLVLGDEYIEELGEVLAIRAHWRDVQRIETDQRRTWLVFAPLIMIVVPNDAFADAAALESFRRDCQHAIASHSRVAAEGVPPPATAHREP